MMSSARVAGDEIEVWPAIASLDHVVTVAAADEVAAAHPSDEIVAAESHDHVLALAPVQGIVAVRADHRRLLAHARRVRGGA